jgi:hypothetical protein
MSLEDVIWKIVPAVAGILLLLGGVFGAVLIFPLLPPVARIGIGYLISAFFTAAGFGLTFKAKWPGRTVMMVGVAFGFFTSFAAGFLPFTIIVPPLVSVVLMFGFVAVMAICSELWKSEVVAGFGFLLGLIAALASAPTSQETTLFALVILAIGAGVLLVRHEWKYLNAAALVFIGIGTLLMWMLSPVPSERGAVLAHLGALGCYYIVFSIAFARWGRVVLARERLAIEAPEQFATPVVKMDGATIAYSSVFAQVNSVVFGALAILLLNFTEVLWPVVHVPLLVMALLEAGRLAIPVLRRGTLLGFHTVTSLGLLSCAIVAYFSGLAESAVLALMTMVVALLASRSKLLGWLRPLTLVTACMAIPGFIPTGATTPIDLLARMLPAVFLLASVLPWETIAVLRPKKLNAGVIEILEILSGNSRAAIASVMMTFALMDWYSPSGETMGGLMIVSKGAILIAGLLLLGAWNWFAAIALAVGFGTFAMWFDPQGGYWFIVAASCWALICTGLWNEVTRQTHSTGGRIIVGLTTMGLVFALGMLLVPMMPDIPHWNGLLLTALAMAIGGVGLVAERSGPWPRLLPEATLEEGQWSITTHRQIPDKVWRFVRVAWWLALVVAIGGWVQVVLDDSRTQLFSAAIVTVLWVALWHYSAARSQWPTVAQWFLAFAALFTICPAVIVADLIGGRSLMVVFLFAAAAVITGHARRNPAMLAAGLGWLAGLGLIAIVAVQSFLVPTRLDGWLIVAAGAAVLIFAAFVRGMLPKFALPATSQLLIQGVLLASGAICIMAATASGATVAGYLATASWGLLAAVLLVGGLSLRNPMMRHAALAIFVLGIGRFLIRDMAAMDLLARAMAAIGLGLLMLLGGIGYWFFRPKDSAAAEAPNTNDPGA